MRRIGLIGGVAWPSTVDYYERICRSRTDGRGSPEMVIASLDQAITVAARGKFDVDASWHDFDRIFGDAMARLAAAGAEVAAIASVTPHNRFAKITENAPIPVVSILDAATQALLAAGLDKAFVLGTKPTLENRLFASRLAAAGLTEVGQLGADGRQFVEDMLARWFYTGKPLDGREALVEFARVQSKGAPVILGCTDLSAAFPERSGAPIFEADGLVWVDVVAAHVDAIMTAARD